MIDRRVQGLVEQLLDEVPAVVLIGPRQVGKTTLALSVVEGRRAVYLDLESDTDRVLLSDAEAYLEGHVDDLVVLDEVHRVPGLFPNLRGLIDRGRRAGRRSGRFLLLGSASLDLLKQSGETLAGRVSYVELRPLGPTEVDAGELSLLWRRGGFPDSFVAESDEISLRWRRNFIGTYLERDIPMLGPRIPAETLRRLWTMLAHQQGGVLNAAQLARNLSLAGRTIAGYLDLMVDLLLVRRLPPLLPNVGKRLVRSPKVYVRDSGLVHALLGIMSADDLAGHPVIGGSWEGFVIENLLAMLPDDVDTGFYRTSAGAEIDLVVQWPGGERWAIEAKASRSPRLERGFHHACEDLRPARRIVVYPGQRTFPLRDGVEVIGLRDLCLELTAAGER